MGRRKKRGGRTLGQRAIGGEGRETMLDFQRAIYNLHLQTALIIYSRT